MTVAPNRMGNSTSTYEDVSKSFRTGRLERELQMLHLSATRCSYSAVLWGILVSFDAITLSVASQRVFIVVGVNFVIDSVRKRLDTPSYVTLAHRNGTALVGCSSNHRQVILHNDSNYLHWIKGRFCSCFWKNPTRNNRSLLSPPISNNIFKPSDTVRTKYR